MFNFKGKNSTLKNVEICDDYVLIRSTNAGVFCGELESMDGDECVLRNARRIWYWDGSASISEIAVKGVSKPESCKFPCEVPIINIKGVIECIPCTKVSRESIKNVPVWTAHG